MDRIITNVALAEFGLLCVAAAQGADMSTDLSPKELEKAVEFLTEQPWVRPDIRAVVPMVAELLGCDD